MIYFKTNNIYSVMVNPDFIVGIYVGINKSGIYEVTLDLDSGEEKSYTVYAGDDYVQVLDKIYNGLVSGEKVIDLTFFDFALPDFSTVDEY